MNDLITALSRMLSGVTCWVMIEPWEQALRIRGGRQVTRLEPGFHWRVPVLDVVHRQTVRRRNSLISTQTLSTADGHTLTVGASLGYAIADIETLYRSLHDAEDTLRQITAAMLAKAVFDARRMTLIPAHLASKVSADLKPLFEGYGLTDVELLITDFAYIRAFRLMQDARWGSGEPIQMGAKR